MPAGGRNVNAPVCRTRDRSNYLVKSRESSFPTSAQTPTNVDHSRRTWYFFNPPAIELLRRSRFPFSLSLSLSLSLSRPSIESYASILQTFEGICGHTVSDDVANQLIIGPLKGSLLFTVQRLRRITPVEKFCRIWEVNRARQTFFSLRLSTHRLSRESFLEI